MKKKSCLSRGGMCVLSFLVIMLAYFPHLQTEMMCGSDDWFHLHRIYALASELKSGNFPVKIHHLAGFGYGYGVGFFYSDFFLYIPAILITFLNISLGGAYRIFALIIFAGIYGSMFYCVYRLNGEKDCAFWAASIYLFSNKVLEAFYCHMALGQMCAFAFFPMAIVGMYLFLEKEESPLLLMVGFIGLIYSHTISTFMALVICMALVILDIRMLVTNIRQMMILAISVCITAMVTASFWLPMFEQMKAQLMKVKAPWTTSVDNVLSISDIWKLQSGLGYVITALFILNVVISVVLYFRKKEVEYKILLILATMIILTLCKPFWYFLNVELGVKFLQFPSRLLAPVTCMVIINTAIILKNDVRKNIVKYLAPIVFIVMLGTSYKSFGWYYSDIGNDNINKVVNNEIAAFGAGEEWLPIMTDREEIVDAKIAIDSEGNQIVGEKSRGYSRYVFIADMGTEYYDIPYIWYKGYVALDERGNKFEISQNGDTGMVRVHMPEDTSGEMQIEVYYKGTKYQRLAYIANGIGVVVFAFYIIFLKECKDKMRRC